MKENVPLFIIYSEFRLEMDLVSQILQSSSTQHSFREVIKQVGHLVYDEIYLFVWLICFYNVLLFLIVATTLYCLLKTQKS